ncbi:unnamed protein product, partial [Rotaria sp. Silwood1]
MSTTQDQECDQVTLLTGRGDIFS